MAIDVEWQDEDGTCLGRYEGAPLDSALLQRIKPGNVCLRVLDPYGDTTFNQAQIEILIEELRETCSGNVEPKVTRVFHDLLQFATKARGHTHTYIKFIGD